MSKMCIYDCRGMCIKHSDDEVQMPCIEGPCEDYKKPKEGEWIVTTEVSDDGAVTSHINCSRCGFYWREPKHGKVFKRCPNCGAKMKTVTDCHALNEKERGEQE